MTKILRFSPLTNYAIFTHQTCNKIVANETFSTENNATLYKHILSTLGILKNTSLFFGFGDKKFNYFRLPTKNLQSLNYKLVFCPS